MNVPARLAPTMVSRKLLVLNFVKTYWARHGASPSYGEIGEGVGCNRSRVKDAVRKLVAEGRLLQTPGQARSLRLPPGEAVISEADALLALRAAGWRVNGDALGHDVTKTALPRLPFLDQD